MAQYDGILDKEMTEKLWQKIKERCVTFSGQEVTYQKVADALAKTNHILVGDARSILYYTGHVTHYTRYGEEVEDDAFVFTDIKYDPPYEDLTMKICYVPKSSTPCTASLYLVTMGFVSANCIGKYGDYMRVPAIPGQNEVSLGLQGTNSRTKMITFLDNDDAPGGNGIMLEPGGLVLIGSGESPRTIIDNASADDNADFGAPLKAGNEQTIISSDYSVYLVAGCNAGYDKKQILQYTSSGHLRYLNRTYFRDYGATPISDDNKKTTFVGYSNGVVAINYSDASGTSKGRLFTLNASNYAATIHDVPITYTPNQEVNFGWRTNFSGFAQNSSTQKYLWITIPISKPLIGVTGFDIVKGKVVIRQNNAQVNIDLIDTTTYTIDNKFVEESAITFRVGKKDGSAFSSSFIHNNPISCFGQTSSDPLTIKFT